VDYKRFRIPNEDAKLITPDEVAITQTRTFQRLFDLKQLGLAYLVYPAASHTRGAHSIRCLHEAAKILDALGYGDERPESRDVRVAALLHDIGHVPFSHSLEDEHVVLKKHDRPSRLGTVLDLLKKELRPEHAESVEHALPILLSIAGAKDHSPDWRSDLVGNTVCADLLAYITTDAAETGIEKRPGYYRIYEYFAEQGNRLCIKLTKGELRNDTVSAIMDLLDMRYALTERVIFHHAKCVASAMLARGARLCKLKEGPELLKMGDEQFFEHLTQLARKPEAECAQKLIEGLRSRRLYKRVFRVGPLSRDAWDETRDKGKFCEKWRDARNVEELLCAVERTHNLPRGSLVLWCPEQEANMKLAEVQVIWDTEDGTHGPVELRSDDVKRRFPGVHERFKTIEDQYLGVWTFWIAIHPACLEHAAGVVRTLEDLIGVDCDRLFVETYLRRLPGFREASARGEFVAANLQELQPEIESELVRQQAGLGGPQGLIQLDEATVLATTASVAERRMAASPSKKAEGQVGLFAENPQGGNQKEKGKSEAQ
jgi:hypothetical protein